MLDGASFTETDERVAESAEQDRPALALHFPQNKCYGRKGLKKDFLRYLYSMVSAAIFYILPYSLQSISSLD